LCYHADDAINLSREFEIVLKPMYSYGGRDIARLSTEYFWMGMDRYPAEMIYSILPPSMYPMLAMRYLPNVTMGDKRTIVVNNQILGSALRVPPPNSWICNIAQGGHAVFSFADEQELMIEAELTPLLYSHGIVMYGFDTLVDDHGLRVLSEINTLSIGGLEPMEAMSGKPILQHTATLIWNYIEEKSEV
jgi:glutathione synthase